MSEDANVTETHGPRGAEPEPAALEGTAPDGATPNDAEVERPARPQRPAVLVFTQSILILQAFVALFATLVLWSFARNDFIGINPWVVLGAGPVLMLVFMYASRQQATRRGRIMGWLLQIPMIAAVFLEPAVAVMGVIFLVLWIMALRIGSRIDRERKEREEAAVAAEDASAPDAPTESDTPPA